MGDHLIGYNEVVVAIFANNIDLRKCPAGSERLDQGAMEGYRLRGEIDSWS